ncbi:MAG: glycine cleavage system protein T [Anaerolineaceae bacterium]|nr:glycine cleavage system protein T [Anaerolineaceae bacterium]
MTEDDYLFRGELDELDPDVAELIRHETARQARTLIMVPSESTVPEAVREAVGSAFHNIYAEGYPTEKTRKMTERELLDYDRQLGDFRRNSDDRYYKGTEYANLVEALTRRRVAELFTQAPYGPDDLYVNVQPLSGAPANSAVYTALLQPGDTILSMNLSYGGHLSHGAPVNRAGKLFNIVAYHIDPETEALDYDAMMQLALEHKPKIVIGGYSSYPLAPDWEAYKMIADAAGAYLMADVAHFAGLIAAGAYPNPVGIADIVTFTTHKTLNGPRGAVIITHHKDLASKIDRGVFPGEQGGPHMNSVAGLAVALRFAQTEQFKQLQHQTVANARRLGQKLDERGLRVVYKGTDSHMIVVDCSTVVGPDGTALSGDMAARILDLIGVVGNRQTIPGDTSALRPSGIRLGTPWITQRGFDEARIDKLATIIADVLQACVPYSMPTTKRNEARARLPFDTFQQAKIAIRDLVDSIGIDTDAEADGYPHFFYLDDAYSNTGQTLAVSGKNAGRLLDLALTSDVAALADGDEQPTLLLEADGSLMASGIVERISKDTYQLHVADNPARVAAWLRSLSDNFVIFDESDPYITAPGPVSVKYIGETEKNLSKSADAPYSDKTYFIGKNGENYAGPVGNALPSFEFTEPELTEMLTTPLHDVHLQLGAKMGEFAGYDMPLWYDKVMNEHLAVRNGAGLFDVTHMGVFEATGPGAEDFLNMVTTNNVHLLRNGRSHYTFLLDTDGVPHDDLMIYRLGDEHFFIVVNASNNDKNWAWLNAIKEGQVCIDPDMPGRTVETAPFELRDLRDPGSGADRRVDIALQGPKSLEILTSLGGSEADLKALKALPWAGIMRAEIGGFDLLISRTGYTGERVAFEVFPHPDQAEALFTTLIEAGAVPCGLAARDSLRIEAGLPLYGHELAGPHDMIPSEAGMGSYVKFSKPWFVGKAAYIARDTARDSQIVRFRMENKGARPAHQGDPLVDDKGRVVGIVTSCSIDSEGYQLGQALVKLGNHKRNTQLAVFAGSERAKVRPLSNMKFGDRAVMPEAVTVLRRFPK